MPESTSNLGKQAVIFSVILLIALGLCGYSDLSGHGAEDNIGVGLLGLLGLAIGGIGLLVTGIRALGRK